MILRIAIIYLLVFSACPVNKKMLSLYNFSDADVLAPVCYMVKGIQSFCHSSVLHQTEPSCFKKSGVLLSRSQRFQIKSGFHFRIRNRERPLSVMVIGKAVHPVPAGFDIEPLFSIIPSDKQMGFPPDKFQRISQLPTHRNGEDRD